MAYAESRQQWLDAANNFLDNPNIATGAYAGITLVNNALDATALVVPLLPAFAGHIQRFLGFGDEVVTLADDLVESADEAIDAANFGPSTVGAAQRVPKVLQSGGNTIRQGTADALSEYAGTNHHRRVSGRALERLKKDYELDSNFHARILDNGDYADETGVVIDNIIGYLD